MNKIILSLAMGLMIMGVGCVTPSSPPTFADITFSHKPKINLFIAEVNSKITYIAGETEQHIEQFAPVSLVRLAEDWASQRIAPNGAEGEFTFTVLKAELLETPLITDQGITALFTNEQAVRYQVRLSVKMQAVIPSRAMVIEAISKITRDQTAEEDLTLNERDKILYQLIEDSLYALDQQLEQDIEKYFYQLLVK